jgi:hypothetical protein
MKGTREQRRPEWGASGNTGTESHHHSRRHFRASMLIAWRTDVRTVTGRLGPSDTTSTLRVWAT